MLFVDGMHLLGEDGGTLLVATGKDGMMASSIPVTFLIVDYEVDNNWTWFMGMLKEALNEGNGRCQETIIFVSDKLKGLINTIATVFPGSSHVYCLRHLEGNFHKALTSTSKYKKGRLCVVAKENSVHTHTVRV